MHLNTTVLCPPLENTIRCNWLRSPMASYGYMQRFQSRLSTQGFSDRLCSRPGQVSIGVQTTAIVGMPDQFHATHALLANGRGDCDDGAFILCHQCGPTGLKQHTGYRGCCLHFRRVGRGGITLLPHRGWRAGALLDHRQYRAGTVSNVYGVYLRILIAVPSWLLSQQVMLAGRISRNRAM